MWRGRCLLRLYSETHAGTRVSSAAVTRLCRWSDLDTCLLRPETSTLLTGAPRSTRRLRLPSTKAFGSGHSVRTAADATSSVFPLTSPTGRVARWVPTAGRAATAGLRQFSSPLVLPAWLLRSSSASSSVSSSSSRWWRRKRRELSWGGGRPVAL